MHCSRRLTWQRRSPTSTRASAECCALANFRHGPRFRHVSRNCDSFCSAATDSAAIPGAIYRYVTEGSFDANMWQALETKARFIGQVMTGDNAARRAEDKLAVVGLARFVGDRNQFFGLLTFW